MADAEENREVAVITGASSGIGRATALRFASEGYDVVLAARRKKELEAVAAECEEQGIKALSLAIDTTDEKAMHELAQAAMKAFSRLDVWVNNAGVYLTGKFEETPLEDMRRLFDINFFGYVHGSQAALTLFRTQGYGTLINISSVNATAPQPYIGIYSASKAAVRALDESLRMELRLDDLQDDVHICTVMPASIDTNLFQNGANYSGKEIQALEPVYNPDYVAKQIVKLAKHPKREVIVGPAGKLMAMQHDHMPKMYERQMSRYTEKDLLSEEPAVMSDGNLFEPIEENNGTSGGWREKRLRADRLNAGIGLSLATAAALSAGAGYFILKRKHSSHSS